MSFNNLPHSGNDHHASLRPEINSQTIDIEELRTIALHCAKSATDKVRSIISSEIEIDSKDNIPNDLVTTADRESEQLILSMLTSLRPGDGILGEEGTNVVSKTGITWVIDPIDGTTNFVRSIPACAVSIAACLGKEPIAGAVINIATLDEYVAARGFGATLNGSPLIAKDNTALLACIVATGFGYDVKQRKRDAQTVSKIIDQVADIRRIGSASLDMCMVATGQVDAFAENGVKFWDIAAGTIIAREAGSKVLLRYSVGQENEVHDRGPIGVINSANPELLTLLTNSFGS